jgi:peptidoglycan/LPS O-acetylase OafA/YrhL
MLAVAAGSRALAIHLDADANMRWMNTFLRLDPLAVGVFLAIVLPGDFGLAPLGRILLGAAGAALPAMCLLVFGLNTGWDMLVYPLVAVGCGMVLVAALEPSKPGIMANPQVAHLGKISYGLYVYHPLCLWIAGALVSSGGLPLALLLTIVMAQTSYVALEAPFLKLKQRFEFVSSRPI